MSRGLVEATKSEPVVVQFIHESVRGFLQKRGLGRESDAGEPDFEAKCHGTLKEICIRYVAKHARLLEKELPVQDCVVQGESPLVSFSTHDERVPVDSTK